MTGGHPVALVGVFVDLPAAYPVVVLREVDPPNREVSIPIGQAEGTAIAWSWKGAEPPRPLTHDLFATVLRQFSVSLEVAEITGAAGGRFFARITLVSGAERQVVECRPSDAIALALRQLVPAPILVEESLFGLPESG